MLLICQHCNKEYSSKLLRSNHNKNIIRKNVVLSEKM